MALVGEIVARFKAETDDWKAKTDKMKADNRALAADLVKTAGDSDRAIKTLQIARKSGELQSFGIDPRQVSGITSAIKSLSKETEESGRTTSEFFAESGKQAKAYQHILHGIEQVSGGNALKGIASISGGLRHIGEGGSGGSFGNSLLGVGLGVTAIGLIAHETAEATEKAAEMKRQFDEGALSGGQIADQLLRSIPVLGNIYATGQSIRDLLGWESHELEHQTEAQNELNEARQRSLDILKASRQHDQESGSSTTKLAEQNKIAALRLTGKDHQANFQQIKNDENNGIVDFAREEAKRVKDAQQQLQETFTKPQKQGGKSLADQAKEASAHAREEAEKLSDQQALAMANARVIAAGGQGADSGELQAQVDAAEEAANQAKAVADWYEKYKADVAKWQKEVQAGSDDQVRARAVALNDRAATQNRAEFGKWMKDQVHDLAGRISGIKLQGQPIFEWIKQQAEKGKKAIEQAAQQAKEQAKQIHDQVNPTEALGDKLDAAVANKNLSRSDLTKYFNATERDLIARRKQLEGSLGQSVYSLPDVREIRAGSSLYAPPSKNDNEQLEELKDINSALDKLNETAAKNGIVIQVIK